MTRCDFQQDKRNDLFRLDTNVNTIYTAQDRFM
jgi:hypothetical protein